MIRATTSRGIAVLGWSEILAGSLAVVMSAVALGGVAQQAVQAVIFALVSVPLVALLPLGIGLLRRKVWARVANLAFCLVVFTASGFYLWMFVSSPYARTAAVIPAVLAICCLSIVAYLLRASVRQQFGERK
jgi:hypothetical protein